MTTQQLLSTQEVADRLQLSVRGVINLVERNELSAYRIGKVWRFDARALEAFLASKRTGPEWEREGQS